MHACRSTLEDPTDERLLDLRVAPGLPVLRSDRVKVKEIVQNLIDNALKHGHGAPVTVDVTPGPDRQTVRLAVHDTGPGIPPELVPHLFEPAHAGSGPTAGTGFGLYIVRCFTEALGGHITTQSAPGQGTTVTVELPLASGTP